MKLFSLLFAFILSFILYTLYSIPAYAISNPLSVPNNKYGIHIISATRDEASEAARLVNTNGDWGYITVLAESGDRNEQKWQEFFNELRRRHLIPLVRLATKPTGSGVWERPYEGEEKAWADFLDKLNWPTKNRYVILYNEPNHASEWGGSVDAADFARTTNRTIDALRAKSDDFFILNAGFDASTPNEKPRYADEEEFLKEMNTTVPGIFNKFDGWVSHSYPNPGFSGKPNDSGRGTIRNWEWEIELLNELGVDKVLPIFITETGWKHSDGVSVNNNFPSPETVAGYFKDAFDQAWNNNRIVAVTPFLLNYSDPPFDQFSFKKVGSELKNAKPGDEYHPAFYEIQNLHKTAGKPEQIEKAQFTKLGLEKDGFTNYLEATSSGISASLPQNETYNLLLTFKNTGQSIWGDGNNITLNLSGGEKVFEQTTFSLPDSKKIEPQGEVTFKIPVKALPGGIYNTSFNLFSSNKPLLDKDYPFYIEVKAPVLLSVTSKLKWKENPTGNYILGVLGELRYALSATNIMVNLDNEGKSQPVEARYLLPDQQYLFTLEKPYYKPKSINQKVGPGQNILDFGELQPDFRSAILRPDEFWKLLPWSN